MKPNDFNQLAGIVFSGEQECTNESDLNTKKRSSRTHESIQANSHAIKMDKTQQNFHNNQIEVAVRDSSAKAYGVHTHSQSTVKG